MRFRAEMGLKFVIVYRSYYKLSGLLIGISILMATESRAQEADSSTSDFFDRSCRTGGRVGEQPRFSSKNKWADGIFA